MAFKLNMKTRFKILIIISITFFIYWPGIPLIALSCIQMTENEFCYDIARLRIPITVNGIWNYSESKNSIGIENDNINESSWGVEETTFEDMMKRKATSAIDLKLQDYGIFFEQLTVQGGFKTSEEPQYFIAEAIAKNNTRYYLTTVFDSDESLEQINVKISKIISDKCGHELIAKGYGCESKYLQALENQEIELRRIETEPVIDPKELFQEKYDAVVEGTIIGCMGHKETYPIRYQCEIQVDSYIKFNGERTSQLTVLAYRDKLEEGNQRVIFGLDYHEDEKYYEIIEIGFSRK